MKSKKNIIIAILVAECIVLALSLMLDELWLPWALCFFAISVLLITKKPIIGLLLFLFFVLPSRVLPITAGFTILKLLFIIAFGAYIIRDFIEGEIKVPDINRVSVAIYILGVVIIISLFYCVDFRLSLKELIPFAIAILIYFLITSMVRSLRDLRLVQQCLMISTIISATFMLFAMKAGGVIRIGAFEADPNFFALSLIMALPIAVSEFFISKSKPWKILSAMTFFLILFSVPATLSRGGLITLIAVLVFMSVNNRKAYQFILPTLVIAGIIFAIFFSAGVIRLDLLGITTPQRIGALVGRFSAMRSAFLVFIHHPVFGVGIGNFIKFYHSYSLLPSSYGAFVAHNMYLEILADLGLVGFIPFFLTIVFSYLATTRARKAAVKHNDMIKFRLAKTCQGMLITFVIGGLFLCTQFYKHFWIALALAVVTEKIGNGRQLSDA